MSPNKDVGKAWRERNREQQKAYKKAWREANIEHCREVEARNREIAKGNYDPVKVHEYNQDYYKKNYDSLKLIRQTKKKELSAKTSAYNALHKEERAAYAKEYRKRNGARLVANSAKWRARVLAGSVGEDELIQKWTEKWRKRKTVTCWWCRGDFSPNDCHLDHIMPLSLGGQHSAANVCISCQPCNNKKRDKTPDQWNDHISQPKLLL